jgi:PRTRC genetic system protein B
VSNLITGAFSNFHAEPKKLIPIKAFIFHSFSNGHESHSSNSELIVTAHPLTQNETGAPVIGAGGLLSEDEIRSLLESLLDKMPEYNGFIPPNVLSISSRHVAWTVRAKVRPMYFKPVGKEKAIRFNVVWPTLLFVAGKKGLAVAALKSNRRPIQNTRLFHAPLMNIYDDGRVCLGSSTMPQEITLETLDAVEKCIFDTNFSHTNHPNTLKEISDKKHLSFWRKLHREKTPMFPVDALNPLNTTVNEFIAART